MILFDFPHEFNRAKIFASMHNAVGTDLGIYI